MYIINTMINRNYLLVTCFFFFLFNCKEDIKTTFSDVTISTENNNIVEINIPKATGNESIIYNINSAINKTAINALHIGENDTILPTSIEESIISFNKEYQSFKTDFPESSQICANIGYTEEGIVLLYNTYEIAPYSTGIIEFTIPFDKVSSLLVFNSSY